MPHPESKIPASTSAAAVSPDSGSTVAGAHPAPVNYPQSAHFNTPSPTTVAVPPAFWLRTGFLFTGLGCLAWAFQPFPGLDDWWLHGVWCIIGLAAAMILIARLLMRGFSLVLTEHRLMFLASFAFYFCFGAALLAWGPANQSERALYYYQIRPADALRVDGLNAVGLGVALITTAFTRGVWLGNQATRAADLVSRAPIHLIILLFLGIGSLASFYSVAFNSGTDDRDIPGIVRILSKLTIAAVFLAGAYKGRFDRTLRVVGGVLTVFSAFMGVLLFSKAEALLPLAAYFTGLSIRYGSRIILPIGLGTVTLTYLLLGNLVSHARQTVGFQGSVTLAERYSIVINGWQETRDLTETTEYATWARLCYTPPQVAAMDLRDNGEGGDGFRTLGWVFVPRFMSSDKPEITRTGREFNEKLTGSSTSSTGVGLFASGYYHGGWIGFLIASMLSGWLLGQTSSIARAISEKDALLLLPFSLLGVLIAFRTDGDFISDYLGAFVFILYPLVILSLFQSAVRSRKPRPTTM